MQEFFASGIPGTEEVLCDELRELEFSSVRFNRGGIPFRGEWPDGWRACMQSRIAQRIQVLLARFDASTPDALYNGVRTVDWSQYLTPELFNHHCSTFAHNVKGAVQIDRGNKSKLFQRCRITLSIQHLAGSRYSGSINVDMDSSKSVDN